MATLYVSFIGGKENGEYKEPLGTQVLTTSTTPSVRTNTGTGASIAWVFSDAAHYVNVGPSASVTASATNGFYLPANEHVKIALNVGDEVAAISLA